MSTQLDQITQTDERSGESNLGSPLREIRTAGSARGDGFQEFNLKAHPYPPLRARRPGTGCSLPALRSGKPG